MYEKQCETVYTEAIAATATAAQTGFSVHVCCDATAGPRAREREREVSVQLRRSRSLPYILYACVYVCAAFFEALQVCSYIYIHMGNSQRWLWLFCICICVGCCFSSLYIVVNGVEIVMNEFFFF